MTKLRALAAAIALVVTAPLANAAALGVWIDTDAACGVSDDTDPDDCYALMAMAKQPVSLRGITTVFGNSQRKDVDATVEALSPLWPSASRPKIASGAAFAGDCEGNAAVDAIATALARERMTILALGPLTNIACLIDRDPAIVLKIDRIVAVMGARAGHVFHPAEGSQRAAFFGHGPVFSDFNAAQDIRAVRRVLYAGVTVVLAPYEAARQVQFGADELGQIASTGAIAAAVVRKSQGWLSMWEAYAGRDGFYPFDLVAAAIILEPSALVCAGAPARVTADRAISGHSFGPNRLLVGPLPWNDDAATVNVEWCSGLAESARKDLLSLFFGDRTSVP